MSEVNSVVIRETSHCADRAGSQRGIEPVPTHNIGSGGVLPLHGFPRNDTSRVSGTFDSLHSAIRIEGAVGILFKALHW